jgi:hypothetical protein
MVWLTVSLSLILVGVAFNRGERIGRLGEKPALWLIAIGLIGQFCVLLTDSPAAFVELPTRRSIVPFICGIVVAAMVAASGFSERSWFGRLRMPLLLLVHFALGIWLLRVTTNVVMDVVLFHRDSLSAFLKGTNPYGLTFPDIIGDPRIYGPTVSVGGRLTIGFPYPPLSLLMSVPGHWAGDYRYSYLLAVVGAAALMAYVRPTRLAAFGATLFLFTPRVFYVLEEGWSEPLVVLFLAAVVFTASRAPKLLPLALGLFLSSKQYAFFALPLIALLMPRPFRWAAYFRVVGIAALVALAITLPFFLWQPAGFWRSVIMFQVLQPFRADALSYLSWFARSGRHWPQWIGFALAGSAVVFGLWRAKRTPAGFAAATALMYALFFAFNKQAFCNYYYFVIGALCIAISAAQLETTEGPA